MLFPPAIVSAARKVITLLEPDAQKQALLIYAELHAQARDPWFFQHAKVPDTLDGRFEMLVLHVFLWVQRMEEETDYDPRYRPVTENILHIMFDDMDQALREMGVGDTGVPRRVKAMGKALYGRMEAYEAALESKETMHTALYRNVYSSALDDADAINALQLYLGLAFDHLRSRPAARLAEGTLLLPPAEALVGKSR